MFWKDYRAHDRPSVCVTRQVFRKARGNAVKKKVFRSGVLPLTENPWPKRVFPESDTISNSQSRTRLPTDTFGERKATREMTTRRKQDDASSLWTSRNGERLCVTNTLTRNRKKTTHTRLGAAANVTEKPLGIVFCQRFLRPLLDARKPLRPSSSGDSETADGLCTGVGRLNWPRGCSGVGNGKRQERTERFGRGGSITTPFAARCGRLRIASPPHTHTPGDARSLVRK